MPKLIQVDKSPEFVAKALDEWAHRRQVKLVFSRPGTPPNNPFIAAVNNRFRQAWLDQNWLESLDDARTIIEAWRKDYEQLTDTRETFVYIVMIRVMLRRLTLS